MIVLNILAVCLAMIESESEQQKFEQIYWEYKDLMFYCAKQKLHDEHLAEDAVNIAFLHLARNMNMAEDVLSARTRRLMITIAERTAINLYKKRQKELNRSVDMDEVQHIAAHVTESDDTVAQAILQLPLEYRQAIILKYSQGYSTREIAAILDCSVAKTEKLLSRGKKKLEKMLKEAHA